MKKKKKKKKKKIKIKINNKKNYLINILRKIITVISKNLHINKKLIKKMNETTMIMLKLKIPMNLI